MADLKTDYKDDVLDTEVNELRKYQMIQNEDGTVSFVDVTEYLQVGDSFGSADINETNAEIEEIKDNQEIKYQELEDAIDTKVTNSFTANRALISDANGNIAASAVTSAELGYLDGVTSAIQTQLSNKLNKGGHAVNKAVVTDGNGNIAPTEIASTEIATLSGVSGNIQTQLNERVKKTIVIAQGVDLNTITESGFYRLNASHVNLPSDGAGTHSNMIVSRGNDTLFQIIVTFGTAQMYVRSAYGVGGTVTWSEWKKYLSASNFHVSGTTLTITL